MSTTPNSLPELLPCPFCGGAVSLKQIDENEDTPAMLVFVCSDSSSCKGSGLTTITQARSRGAAIAAWNTRAALASPEPELFKACQELGPWMAAAIDDEGACVELRTAASNFIEALHSEIELRIHKRLASPDTAGWQPNSGVARIAAERQRQVSVEGWTPEHDAEHGGGELAIAAACYAAPPYSPLRSRAFGYWPWANHWWKPANAGYNPSGAIDTKDRIRELEKAGALIAAEIDRLSAAPQPPKEAI